MALRKDVSRAEVGALCDVLRHMVDAKAADRITAIEGSDRVDTHRKVVLVIGQVYWDEEGGV
jgi:hypothetical protein